MARAAITVAGDVFGDRPRSAARQAIGFLQKAKVAISARHIRDADTIC